MLELSVGMGLMSSIFACNVRLKKRKSDIMHSGLIVIVLIVMIALIVLMSSFSIIDLNDVKR